MKWIIKHLKLLLAILTFGVTAVIIGVVMLTSYTSYQKYEKEFYKNDLEVRSMVAAAPRYIEIDDKYKSSYKEQLVVYAEDLNKSKDVKPVGDKKEEAYLPGLVEGGTINITINLAETSFVDINFLLNSTYKTGTGTKTKYGSEDLLGNVNFKVNGNLMEEDVDLLNDGQGQNWHHLVMSGFAIPKGQITIEIASIKNKTAFMPDIKNIVVSANAALALQKAQA